MAALAVRERSAQHVRDGLTAIVIEDGRCDFRESIQAMGLLYDACIRIGANAIELFDTFGRSARSSELAEELMDFPRRKPSERSLEAMGYKTVEEAEGFRYRRRW